MTSLANIHDKILTLLSYPDDYPMDEMKTANTVMGMVSTRSTSLSVGQRSKLFMPKWLSALHRNPEATRNES